ncbi:ThuA domain-containing protein [Micromonospora sp. NBC_01796]|uniref:ThuA domain-containing protein n=1 Tax=Micromonospora sp. NBC_01796 TaxID=2975987 RepID=UPI002DDA0D42|nr:ThuA domain-containing protein [Micromonospora sp. NBC_01796]WSA87567.1 ThuA domain-containing protein [Micromonospora sp. NBC_01796]
MDIGTRTPVARKRLVQLLALFLALICVSSSPAIGNAKAAAAAPAFNVIAFYNGTWDAAHISFVREANQWFPQIAAQNNFTYTATTDWSRLNTANLAQYQVVLFLDDLPPVAQRPAFQQYMQNGGAWLGFHVSAFNTNPGGWDWYHNQFLGTGAFRNNTWGPTTAVLRVEDQTHPSTARLPQTFTSSVSEWYSWNNDLRNNPNIDILASVDQSSFPLGTDPNQTWRSGYYPIIWRNVNYKMLYANFGHNAMNYENNTPLSSTFASEVQNRFLIDGLLWLGGGGGTTPPPTTPISPTAWYTVVNAGNGKCVDSRAAGTANGTAIQQYTCNNSNAQQFQFQPTSGGFVRVNNRANSARSIDVTNVSTADNAPIQLWTYTGGNNQQWQPVAETGGTYRLVNRLSGKCLDVPGASTANSVQLVQYACNGSAAQSFRLVQQP